MTSTTGSLLRRASKAALGLAVAVFVLLPIAGRAESIPRPAGIQADVDFWIRVYTEVTTNEGFLHDERNLSVVYEAIKFGAGTSPRERQRLVDDRRDRYVESLRRIAAALSTEEGRNGLSAEDRKVLALWGPNPSAILLRDAAQRIRFQLGQADRFKEGLIRSSSWSTHIAETFANQGLPPELAVLPHVESSFNPAAYSKVGAAGLWQFMRSTGRRYMRVDDAVDERLDPYRSTEAAAQLLAYNYRALGSWPLALTAYNHGAAGMRRARDTVGTDDFVKINRTYNSRTFGFASRNFFPSFLAALTIDENPEKYFGALDRRPELKFHEVAMPAFVRLTTLERTLGLDREQLRTLNPAWRPTIYQGTRLVPRGYRLRLPADTREKWTAELLMARLPPNELYAGQITPRSHRVRKGESMQSIAAHYGMTAARLAQMNGLNPNAQLRAGRRLHLPEQLPRTLGAPAVPASVVAAATPPASPENATAETAPAEEFYVVRRGDSLQLIAARVKVPEAQLLRMNALKDPDRLYEGQRLRIAREAAPAVVAAVAPDEVETSVATLDAARGEAQREASAVEIVREETTRPIGTGEPRRGRPRSAAVVAMEAASTAEVAESVVQAAETAREPVSASQAEDLSPALGPVSVTQALADSIDYQVRDDGSIRVEATETLGHYADWLQIPTQRLRNLNKLKARQPVQLGQKLSLDYSKVSREAFEQVRRDYHVKLQGEFFVQHRIAGTEVYIVRRGDSLWTMTQRFSNLPIWLLRQYNPDTDLADLRPGTQVVMPKVEVQAGS
ncbi:MAG TPA: LysM peptidoglycan-binding domain-containing protein [Steroidobacteraceae bacterium]|nr:LysM peptidoglycan-binding domain-containing protein [Steroidobacteraceae bacterium]